jgi:hypothetical protein
MARDRRISPVGFNLLVWICILSIGIPVMGGALYALLHGSTPERRAPLYDALRAFAREQGAEIDERDLLQGRIQCEVRCVFGGESCSIRLGWEQSDFTLRLGVQVPRLSLDDFEECWDRDWVRYLKRDYDQRIYVNSSGQSMSLSGPSHSLREVFAEVDLAQMANLFGAPVRGPSEKFRHLSVKDGGLSVRVDHPGPEHLDDLAGKLRALVRLAKFSCRPFGEDPGVGPTGTSPRAVGKVVVSVQAGQRCSYCREALIGGDAGPVKTCAACNSSLHAACLAEHGGCCTVGCRNNPRR